MELTPRVFIFCGLAAAAIISVIVPPPEGRDLDRRQAPKQNADSHAVSRQINAMAAVIRLYGYDCQHVENALPKILSRGFNVVCRGRMGTLYEFELTDHGGKWQVTAD